MVTAAAAADDSRTPDERGRQEDESEEEDEVESGDEDEGDGDGSEVTRLSDLCDPDAGSDEDPTFDPDADGDLEVEIVLRSRMSWMSISASACKGRKGSAVLAMGKEEIDLLAMVDKLIHDGELEKLKVYQCKSYLRMHKLRLTGKKEVLLNRIRDHIEVKNAGEEKYPVSSFVLNCKGDACKGDVVMFEQNIYRRKKGAPREVKHLCGQRTNAGRIIKESYGTAKQQHTFTIEILWSKGYKPWSPLHPLLIKGRNLYKEKTMRQPWTDEEERNTVLKEKHARGFVARKSRASRIQEKEIEKKMRFNRIKENKTKEQLDMNQKPYKKVIPQVLVEPMTTVHQRTGEGKCPSLQNGEPENTRHQHLPLKATPTKHNEVLPQKGATRTFKQEFINHQVPSIQHRELQKQQHLPLKAGPTQYNEVLPQNGATRTFKQEFINHQVPSIQHGGLQQQLYPQPTHTQQMFKDQYQQPKYQTPTLKHQDHNRVLPRNDVRSHSGEVFDYQNNSCRAAKGEPAYHPRGNFTRHGSNFRQNGPADHQVHPPLRSRNWDFNSRDQHYGQDYYPQQNQHQNNRWNTTQDQYHMGQNQYQNYHDQGRTK
ncbi:hypothetical protein QOZ80_2BG0178220 [Eleusine coracana subsp. coracana]|nr:hypothetical protein QOZ80_2BG0178220 [Eleusine coracana subsp. coracana]